VLFAWGGAYGGLATAIQFFLEIDLIRIRGLRRPFNFFRRLKPRLCTAVHGPVHMCNFQKKLKGFFWVWESTPQANNTITALQAYTMSTDILSATPLSAATAVAEQLSMADQIALAMSLLSGLKKQLSKQEAKAVKKAAKKAASAASDDASCAPSTASSGRGKSVWHEGLNYVRERLLASSAPSISLKDTMPIASVLKAEGVWPKPSDEAILAAYETWAETHSEAASAASNPKAPKAPKAELTDAEKDAKRKAKAEKASATRAANKAAKAAEDPSSAASSVASEKKAVKKEKKASKKAPSAPAAPAAAPAEPKATGGEETLTHDGHSYMRVENWLWDGTTYEWVGVWDPKTKTIDTTVSEPDFA